MIETTED